MTDHVPAVGDIGFSTSPHPMGKLIRLGTRLKFKKALFNHEFVIDRIVDGVPYVIQATIHGVTDSMRLDEVAHGGTYTLISPPPEVDIDKLLFFCRSQVGTEYGILTIAAIAIDVVSWQWIPAFRGARKNSWICSALIEEGLRYAGWYHDWVDIYNMFPDESYFALVVAEGTKAFIYEAANEWPFHSPFPVGVELATAPIVQAHAVTRALHETVWTPTHPKRGESSAEFQASKKALEAISATCWICGKTAEESGLPLEGHHLNTEWSLINSADWAKVQENFPHAKDLETWLDSTDNLILLCAKCHRSPLYGVHMVTMPAWIVQKYQLEGWDLVNGPNHTSAAALDDQSGYYPEH